MYYLYKLEGQQHVAVVKQFGKEGCHLAVGETGDATSDTGNVESQVGTASYKGDELIDVRLYLVDTAVHGRNGIALTLQTYPLPPNSAK